MANDKKPDDLLDWLGLPERPDFSKARPLGSLVGAILALVVPVLFLFALLAAGFVVYDTMRNVVTQPPSGSSPNLGAGALIAALLGAPFVIWGTVLKWQTVRYQKEGHMTDRISKAVEQLGAEKTVKKDGKEETVPNIEVRIGAILALERIAQDSTRFDNGRDHVPVMEILCAFIRQNAPASSAKDHALGEIEALKDNPTDAEVTAHLEKVRDHVNNVQAWASELPPPRADVQMALHVIGRRNTEQRRVEAAWPDRPTAETVWPFDPNYARLPDEPTEKPLPKAELDRFLAGLDAWKKTCSAYSGYRLDLRGTNLQGADLDARRTDGSDAVFSGAWLIDARMEGVSLFKARMEFALLVGARIEGGKLFGTRLEGTRFGFANMRCATLFRSSLEGANLLHARLQGAIFQGVKLAHALNLATTDLSLTFGDGSVTLPEGVDPPAHWPQDDLNSGAFNKALSTWRSSP